MKGDTSSGLEPVATLEPASILMFAQDAFGNKIQQHTKKTKHKKKQITTLRHNPE